MINEMFLTKGFSKSETLEIIIITNSASNFQKDLGSLLDSLLG